MSRFAKYDPRVCLNCEASLSDGMGYCPNCGQRNREHKRSVLDFIKEGFSSFLQIEGRSWNTLRDLVVPGRLPVNYLNGQRERYLHPLRALLLSSIICFAAISAAGGDYVLVKTGAQDEESTLALDGVTAQENEFSTVAEGKPNSNAVDEFIKGYKAADKEPPVEEDLANEVDNILVINGEEGFAELKASSELDQARKEILEELEEEREDFGFGEHPLFDRMTMVNGVRARIIARDMLRARYASLDTSGLLSTAGNRQIADTLAALFVLDTKPFNFQMFGDSVSIPYEDLATKTPAEISMRLDTDRTTARLILQKIVSLIQNGTESLNEYLFQNLTWAILLFIPIMALGYKIFYWKRVPYYAQHLTFTAFTASAILLFGAFAVCLNPLVGTGISMGVLAAGSVVFVILSERRMYDYPIWKVLIKSAGLAVYGLFAFTVALVLWLTVAVLFV